jgi:predicted nucleotidyltransferase
MTEVRHRGAAGANLEIMVFISGVDVDERRLAEICDRYGIAELQIFGSRARGTSGPDSDIDVLYTLRPGRRLGWEIEELADELTDLFGHRVDLVSLRALHPMLRPSVLAEARPVYAA